MAMSVSEGSCVSGAGTMPMIAVCSSLMSSRTGFGSGSYQVQVIADGTRRSLQMPATLLLVDSRFRGNDGRSGANDVQEGLSRVCPQPGHAPVRTDSVSHRLFRQFAFDAGPDLIPHVPKHPQALFVAAGGLGRVGEGAVQALTSSWEDRTGLVRVVAHGDDEIQGLSKVEIQRLRFLGGDIYPDLGHDRDRLRPDTRRLGTRAERLEAVPGHLGAGRVVGAQEENTPALRSAICARATVQMGRGLGDQVSRGLPVERVEAPFAAPLLMHQPGLF